MWIGTVALVILAAFTLWWVSSNQPLNTSTSNQTTFVAASASATTSRFASEGVAHRDMGAKAHERDVISLVASLSGASVFNSELHATGVASTLNPASVSSYTIFVPVNRAFATLPDGSISSLSAAEKKRFVEYHIVSGRALDLTAQSAGTIQALSGDAINLTYEGGTPMVNNSRVLAAYEASNGIIYVIDNPLLPPKNAAAF